MRRTGTREGQKYLPELLEIHTTGAELHMRQARNGEARTRLGLGSEESSRKSSVESTDEIKAPATAGVFLLPNTRGACYDISYIRVAAIIGFGSC